MSAKEEYEKATKGAGGGQFQGRENDAAAAVKAGAVKAAAATAAGGADLKGFQGRENDAASAIKGSSLKDKFAKEYTHSCVVCDLLWWHL